MTINRPEALNALNSALLHDLRETLARLAREEDSGAVILTGGGDAFIAGADIKEMRSKSVLEARTYGALGQECADMLETMHKPTLAAINGYALGGGLELALGCDIRYASTRAKLGQPEVNLGIIPGWGGTQRLARIAGIGFAKELILTGRTIDAKEAQRHGLITALFEPAELLPRTLELAQELAEKSPLALAYAKEATNRALHGDLGANLAEEVNLFSILFSTEDAKEGLDAFMEKRGPGFVGH
ncbi:MAG: enoyl-CoA hydratase-related protein [Gaiellaceae bacterium]